MVQVREARRDDAQGIAQVHVASWRSTYHGIMPAEFLAGLSVERRTQYWMETLAELCEQSRQDNLARECLEKNAKTQGTAKAILRLADFLARKKLWTQAAAAYNPTAAKALLTGAGFTYKGSTLIDPKGNAVDLDIHVISGWSDWVASNQIITKNLSDIGISSKVALEPDWGSWQPNAMSTKNPTLLWQGGSQGSPYGFFYANLSQNAFIEAGTDASPTGNWEHFANAKATALLNQWKGTLDVKKQHKVATQLEKIWLQQLPIVPLFIGPRWSTYSTRYFHCYDTPKNFFGDPIFTTFPDNVLSFTRICPGGKAGP